AHGVAVILDDVDYRQLPQRCHVEAFVDLTLIGSAIAEISQRYIVVVAIAIRECEACAERNLRTDDTMTAVEVLLFGEHVHGAALALGKAAATSGQFSHHAARAHARCKHMTMIAIGGDNLIALPQPHPHAPHHALLP